MVLTLKSLKTFQDRKRSRKTYKKKKTNGGSYILYFEQNSWTELCTRVQKRLLFIFYQYFNSFQFIKYYTKKKKNNNGFLLTKIKTAKLLRKEGNVEKGPYKGKMHVPTGYLYTRVYTFNWIWITHLRHL